MTNRLTLTIACCTLTLGIRSASAGSILPSHAFVDTALNRALSIGGSPIEAMYGVDSGVVEDAPAYLGNGRESARAIAGRGLSDGLQLHTYVDTSSSSAGLFVCRADSTAGSAWRGIPYVNLADP